MAHIRLYNTLFAALAAGAALLNVVAAADPAAAQCRSSGVNFVDGQTYSIQSASTAPFTIVSRFEGISPCMPVPNWPLYLTLGSAFRVRG